MKSSSVGEEGEELYLYTLLVGMWTGATILMHSLPISTETYTDPITNQAFPLVFSLEIRTHVSQKRSKNFSNYFLYNWHKHLTSQISTQRGLELLKTSNTDVLDQIILCCGNYLVHYRMFSSILGLYPLGVMSNNQKYLKTLPHIPWRGKLPHLRTSKINKDSILTQWNIIQQ